MRRRVIPFLRSAGPNLAWIFPTLMMGLLHSFSEWVAAKTFDAYAPTMLENVLAIGIFVGLAAPFFYWCYRFWRRRGQLGVAGVRMSNEPRRRRGLILMVGSSTAVCRKAILHHSEDQKSAGTLERIWLICSAQSRSLAEDLIREFPGMCDPTLICIQNVYDCSEYYEGVRRVYRERKPADWSDDDIICDITGMTALGSVGMVLACIGRNRPLQYTPANFDARLKVIDPLTPSELEMDWFPVVRTGVGRPGDAR